MKAPLYRPRLYFNKGYWRVTIPGRAGTVTWRNLRLADQRRIKAAHDHAAKLNGTAEAIEPRQRYARRLGLTSSR